MKHPERKPLGQGDVVLLDFPGAKQTKTASSRSCFIRTVPLGTTRCFGWPDNDSNRSSDSKYGSCDQRLDASWPEQAIGVSNVSGNDSSLSHSEKYRSTVEARLAISFQVPSRGVWSWRSTERAQPLVRFTSRSNS